MTSVLEQARTAQGDPSDAALTGREYRCPPELTVLDTIIRIVDEHPGRKSVEGPEADKLLRQIDNALSDIPANDGDPTQLFDSDHGWLRRGTRILQGGFSFTQSTKGEQEQPHHPKVFVSQFIDTDATGAAIQDTRISFQFAHWIRVAKVRRGKQGCEVSVTTGRVGDVRGRRARGLVITGTGR